MQTRRWFLQAACAAGLTAAHRVDARQSPENWSRWVASYVENGRIIDLKQNAITHSEGQGYGLLLAQAHADETAFREIEQWTAQHLAVRKDRLMAWRWTPRAGSPIVDWQNATDGDLFRAWALLRAERDSGWSGFRQTAVGIARDIANLCLSPDPRAPDALLLLPGAESRHDFARVLINPSYFMSRALRELGEAAEEPRLIRAADHGETVLAELAATRILPNWVDVTASGFADPAEHAMRWGYDALRISLYLTWSGRGDHPAVKLAVDLMAGGAQAGHLVVEATDEGQVLNESDQPGFQALRSLSLCQQIGDKPLNGLDYYSESLLMLAEIAQSESVCDPK